MDRGTILSIYTVISGWILIIMALLLIKFILSSGQRGFLISALYVLIGLASLTSALALWYMSVRKLFLKIKLNGPGGT
jgi:hypothetical protein